MRILSVLPVGSVRYGGPSAFAGEAALELARLGARTRILTTDLTLAPAGWVRRQPRIAAAELHPSLREGDVSILRARFPRRFAFSPELARAARAAAPGHDVVHLHSLWLHPQYAGARAARAAGRPYVVSPHGALDPYLRRHGRGRKRLVTALWQRRLLEQASAIHVTTDAEASLIADIAPEVPRIVVPPGLDVVSFQEDVPPAEEFAARYLGGDERRFVLFLGRLTYKKGLDVLLDAFAVARRDVDVRLVIAGPDDERLRAGLERHAERLGLDNEVSFVGPLYGGDRLAALAACSAWALSSHTENFGIAVAEALAAGCATVVSPAVNIADDIAAEGAGIRAELEPEAFGAALAQVLADERLRTDLERRAPVFAGRYDWSVVAPRLLAMYEDVARRGG